MELLHTHRINPEIYFTGEDLDKLSPPALDAIKAELSRGATLSVHAPYMDLSPGAVDSAVGEVTLNRFLRACEAAHRLGAVTVVVHSGYEKWKYDLHTDIWLAQSVKTWTTLHKAINGTGLKIAVENIFEDEPSNLQRLMAELPSERFGLCFDAGHFNIFSKIPLNKWLEMTKSRTIELHLHDNDRTADHHRAIGDGVFPFDELFPVFNNTDCLYTIEGHSKEAVLGSLRYLGVG
jgi:sugar phosphate isomerase/epimerase